jgi:hypothetical protein
MSSAAWKFVSAKKFAIAAETRDEIWPISAPVKLERAIEQSPGLLRTYREAQPHETTDVVCGGVLNDRARVRTISMTENIRILFLSANPWTTSRILVDEEEREIFERLQEGRYRDKFELHKHAAIRPNDLQRFLMMYEPHIVHFSGHASKRKKIILGGSPGRGKEVDRQGLVEVFALYQNHVRLVFLNACFTRIQARSLSRVVDYSMGTGNAIGDKGGVAFAGAFYRALSFGKSVKEAFQSAKAEMALTKMPRMEGFELFVRDGIDKMPPFPKPAMDVIGQPRTLIGAD